MPTRAAGLVAGVRASTRTPPTRLASASSSSPSKTAALAWSTSWGTVTPPAKRLGGRGIVLVAYSRQP